MRTKKKAGPAERSGYEEGRWSDLLGLYTSMSSRSCVLKDALAPSVLARTFSTWPLSEPRNTTV